MTVTPTAPDQEGERLYDRIHSGHAGAERLLLRLAQRGLRAEALPVAAALVARLDDDARERDR